MRVPSAVSSSPASVRLLALIAGRRPSRSAPRRSLRRSVSTQAPCRATRGPRQSDRRVRSLPAPADRVRPCADPAARKARCPVKSTHDAARSTFAMRPAQRADRVVEFVHGVILATRRDMSPRERAGVGNALRPSISPCGALRRHFRPAQWVSRDKPGRAPHHEGLFPRPKQLPLWASAPPDRVHTGRADRGHVGSGYGRTGLASYECMPHHAVIVASVPADRLRNEISRCPSS